MSPERPSASVDRVIGFGCVPPGDQATTNIAPQKLAAGRSPRTWSTSIASLDHPKRLCRSSCNEIFARRLYPRLKTRRNPGACDPLILQRVVDTLPATDPADTRPSSYGTNFQSHANQTTVKPHAINVAAQARPSIEPVYHRPSRDRRAATQINAIGNPRPGADPARLHPCQTGKLATTERPIARAR